MMHLQVALSSLIIQAGGHGEDGRKPMEIIDHLTPNATLLPQIVIFIVLILFLDRLLFKPMIAYLEAREKATQGAQDRVSESLADLDKQAEEIDARINEARKKGQSVRDGFRGEGQEEASQIRSEAHEESETLVKNSRGKLESQIAEAQKDISGFATEISKELASKLLGRAAN